MPDGPPEPEDAYVVYDDDGAPPPDLDAPLLEHRYERTTPKVTGAPWDMAAWIAEDRARRAALGEFDAGGHVERVAPGWWCEPAEMPRKPKAIATRLSALPGWEVRCSQCIVYVTPTLFVSANEHHSKGEQRYRDHDDTFASIHATYRAGEKVVAAFWATWVTREEIGRKTSTTFNDVVTYDVVLGRDFGDKAKEFEGWLAVFAPV